jgi:hypothetical protein
MIFSASFCENRFHKLITWWESGDYRDDLHSRKAIKATIAKRSSILHFPESYSKKLLRRCFHVKKFCQEGNLFTVCENVSKKVAFLELKQKLRYKKSTTPLLTVSLFVSLTTVGSLFSLWQPRCLFSDSYLCFPSLSVSSPSMSLLLSLPLRLPAVCLSLSRCPFLSVSVSYNVSPCHIPVVSFFLTVSPCCLIYSSFPLCPTFILFMSSLLYVFPSVFSFFLFFSLPPSMPSLSSPPFVYLSVCISLSLWVSHSYTLFIRPKSLSYNIFSTIFSPLTNENIYFGNYYNEQRKFTNDSYSI